MREFDHFSYICFRLKFAKNVRKKWRKRECSPVNLAFNLSLLAFYDFIFVSCLSCLEVCSNERLPKSDDRNMFKFAFEI